MSERAAVVTCFLRNRGELLLLRRADDAGTYPGRWAGVSGYIEHDDPAATARMEIREETALTDVTLVRRGAPVTLRDDDLDREWTVHPFLFDADARTVTLNEENVTAEWVPATEILRRDTVPGLWTAYERVAPSPETIESDAEHGAAYLSIEALEALRDAAGTATVRDAGYGAVADVADALLSARPSMAVLENRVNRVMADAGTPADVEVAAIDGIRRAIRADEAAAVEAAALIDDTVLTLSRSGTVHRALREADPEVFVAESRPAREGIDVAERLASAGFDVTVCTDAAVAHVLSTCDVDAVVVGADTVLADGRVINKTGTRSAALAAAREGIPVYVIAATDKIAAAGGPRLEPGDPEAVYAGDADIRALNPTFDVTPAKLVSSVVTERGSRTGAEIEEIARELRELADWRDGRA